MTTKVVRRSPRALAREHGDYQRYLEGPDENDRPGKGCRCRPCTAAATARTYQYRQYKARERWGAAPPLMVPAAPVRDHVRKLMDAGVPRATIVALSGVAGGAITSLLYRNPPLERITYRNAHRLLAVSAADAVNVDGYMDAAGTKRRLQALVAIGWPQSTLARRLGLEPQVLIKFLNNNKRVHASRARAVRALYEELWNVEPQPETSDERRAVSRARTIARRRGWAPPGGWDDDLIDLPEEELAAELRRRAEAMDDSEARACHRAYYEAGDRSPLVAAGAREWDRRSERRRREQRREQRRRARERRRRGGDTGGE